MKDKEKQYVSMKEILTKRSFEPITNCNCKIESRIEEQTELQKEIEAMQYFANKNAVSILDIVNTCSVEKQIDEMAKDIYEQKSCDTSYEANCKLLAYDLVMLGWIKLPEDSVVLTMTEHAKLVAQVRDEFEHEYKDKVVLSKDDYEAIQIKIEQLTKYAENERQLREYYCNETRKEMAEKYHTLMNDCIKSNLNIRKNKNTFAMALSRDNDELAKQFGAEIKE